MPITPYADADDMKSAFDVRRLGDLVSDDEDTRVPEYELDTNTNLLSALRRASGLLDSAALAGKRYTTADLAAFASADATSTSEFLRYLVCCLAYGLLVQRRGHNSADLNALAPGWEWAQTQLELLRGGQRIFELDGVAEAGLPKRTFRSKDRGLISGDYARRYFGNLEIDPRNRSI